MLLVSGRGELSCCRGNRHRPSSPSPTDPLLIAAGLLSSLLDSAGGVVEGRRGRKMGGGLDIEQHGNREISRRESR